MNRTTFTILGHHTLSQIIRDHFIVNKKFQLVNYNEHPDFVILGAEKPPGQSMHSAVVTLTGLVDNIKPSTPVLLLSTGEIYSDRDEQLKVSENKPMSEERGLVITSPMDPVAHNSLYTIMAETLAFQMCQHVLSLRVFEVYGPGLSGTVQALLDTAVLKQDINLESPGYQIRTYLHIDDAISAVDRLLPKFLGGARGIYNLGSTEEISLKRLADSVWQLTNSKDTDTPIVLVPPSARQVWWRVPDTTRLQALTGWKPSMSLRKGLWTLIKV